MHAIYHFKEGAMFKKVVQLAALALTTVCGCPFGYFEFGGSYCYRVSETRMDWGEAQEVRSMIQKNIFHLLNLFSTAGALEDTWQSFNPPVLKKPLTGC